MDALMAALVAALVVQATDRTPWLVAILADRTRAPRTVILAATLALAIGYGLAATAGALLGPRLTPEAQRLFVALSLLSAGASAFFPIKPPDRLGGWRLGGFLTTLLGVAILALGDRTQFIVATLAARSPAPALAAVGGLIGTLAVVIPAALAGEAARAALPIVALRVVTGALLVIVGTVLALGALRLI